MFYDKGWETDGWRYLEAAPSDILLGDSASYHSFGYHRTSDQGSNMTVGTGTGIGSGKENTQKLVGAMGSSVYRYSSDNNTKTTQYAAKMCAEYRGGGYADWFLPSKSELNLMYQNLKKNNLGGFSGGYYWSSSEYDANYAWYQYFDFGTQYFGYRRNGGRVRPVRAF